MTTDSKYNGWTNYETWIVARWMDNDEGSQEFFHGMAREALERFTADNSFMLANARSSLVDTLKQCYDEAAEEWMGDQPSVWADLMNAALGSVNWYEIAQSLIDEVR